MTNNEFLSSFDHFHATDNGMIELWSVDTCENCDAVAIAPNSVKVGGHGIELACANLGLTERDSRGLGELGHDDDLGMAVCCDCAT